MVFVLFCLKQKPHKTASISEKVSDDKVSLKSIRLNIILFFIRIVIAFLTMLQANYQILIYIYIYITSYCIHNEFTDLRMNKFLFNLINFSFSFQDGVFVFWEHVCASDERIASKQRLFAKIWYILYGGCHLTRKSWEYVEKAQFSTHEFSTINLPFISLISTTLYGSATK